MYILGILTWIGWTPGVALFEISVFYLTCLDLHYYDQQPELHRHWIAQKSRGVLLKVHVNYLHCDYNLYQYKHTSIKLKHCFTKMFSLVLLEPSTTLWRSILYLKPCKFPTQLVFFCWITRVLTKSKLRDVRLESWLDPSPMWQIWVGGLDLKSMKKQTFNSNASIAKQIYYALDNR